MRVEEDDSEPELDYEVTITKKSKDHASKKYEEFFNHKLQKYSSEDEEDSDERDHSN